MSKQDIIAKIYYDPSGFSSKANTLKESKKKDPSITKEDVDEFFSKNIEERRKPRGQNSFVAPHPYHTFQMDLFFISEKDLQKQKFRIGLLTIDVFTKWMSIVPIKSKQPPDVLAGIMESIKNMGKKSQLIYTDEEGSFGSQIVLDYLEEQKIALHRTRSHPAFSERGIRTFKDALFKRVEYDEKQGKQNIEWTDYVFPILLTYNTKNIHSATGLTPAEARKPKNEVKAKLNMTIKATKTRKYPELEVGSQVKVMRKKGITEKERSSHWNKEIKTVRKIETKLGQKYYILDGDTVGYLRHELLKV